MFVVLTHQPLDPAQVGRAHLAAIGEPHVIEPEFALAVAVFDVHVCRLVPFVRVEVEAEGADAEDRGHPIY